MLKTLLTKTLLVVMGRRKEKNGTDDCLEVKQTTAGKNCTLQELDRRRVQRSHEISGRSNLIEYYLFWIINFKVTWIDFGT